MGATPSRFDSGRRHKNFDFGTIFKFYSVPVMGKSFFFLLFVVLIASCGGAEEEFALSSSLDEPVDEEEFSPSDTLKSAVTNTGATVAAEAGYITDGATITIPEGFAASQCVFTAALANVSGSAISSRATVNPTTGQVTCRSVVQEREEVQPTEKSCVASYTVICAK
ncbi:MAG: hypothetical protein HYT77_08745 [Deltaproteobacteria bacterium]|nr:hypothetical protein [Deltaproteobacteria bacterium]